jgi:hypothetical protein
VYTVGVEDRTEVTKQPGRNLYLYLALACFLGIVLIFLFDGYLGVYDSLKADGNRGLQEIPAEQWLDPGRDGAMFMNIDQEGYLDFTYTISNRRFIGFSEEVRVTVVDGTGVPLQLADEVLTAGAFGNGEITWTLDAGQLQPPGTTSEGGYSVDLFIRRDNVTRQITLYVNRPVVKSLPVPTG